MVDGTGISGGGSRSRLRPALPGVTAAEVGATLTCARPRGGARLAGVLDGSQTQTPTSIPDAVAGAGPRWGAGKRRRVACVGGFRVRGGDGRVSRVGGGESGPY